MLKKFEYLQRFLLIPNVNHFDFLRNPPKIVAIILYRTVILIP